MLGSEAEEALRGLIGDRLFVEARFWLGEFNKPLISMLESGHIEPKIEASMNRQFALLSTVIHALFAESLMAMMAEFEPVPWTSDDWSLLHIFIVALMSKSI